MHTLALHIFGAILGSILLAKVADAYLSSAWTLVRTGVKTPKELLGDLFSDLLFRARCLITDTRELFR